MTVTNPDSRRLIQIALKRTGHLDEWDGRPPLDPVTYPIESDEGLAILASPNGQGPAWFLAQHKEQLGRLRIESVMGFRREDDMAGLDRFSLLFHIRPHPNDVEWPDDEGEGGGGKQGGKGGG